MAASGKRKAIHVAELFAGVGGFRLGLERASPDFVTTFSSQWEPPGTESKQFASRCYRERFGDAGHYNEDIAKVLDEVEHRRCRLPAINMVVGGFPCQDYSVAKPLNQSAGLQGKKGVLWWQIHRLLSILKARKRPAEWVLLENVDRLIKSPVAQRGRDFAVMLASLSDLGYEVEWRVVNAADYGFPQKRRRVFIVARYGTTNLRGAAAVYTDGVLARALPLSRPTSDEVGEGSHFRLKGELSEISADFGRGVERTKFEAAGFIRGREVWTYNPKPAKALKRLSLRSCLQVDSEVDESFWIPEAEYARWSYVKGRKSEKRVHKQSGFEYHYSEGALPFPDHLDAPARTILTSEGGRGPSRSKHVVRSKDGHLRRLTPVELERLNGFDDEWTAGMTPNQRAFCMGNALVVGLVQTIAAVIASSAGLRQEVLKREHAGKGRE